jgi:hypothetical protein
MAPKGKPVEWLCETPTSAAELTHELIATVKKTGGYAITETSVGLVLTRKYFPTWRVLVLGIPAVVLGRKAEVASVIVEPLAPLRAQLSVSGRPASWMRNDIRAMLEGLNATPADFARRRTT